VSFCGSLAAVFLHIGEYHMDVVFLSRLQFAFTISFHIIFPALSIGLVTFLMVMEGLWLKTQNPLYKKICKFWMKVFALTFGMGVVSGIVMAFQLGTNWAGFTREIGDVLGPLFTYEVMTAFFIEAGFLGVMLFGWDKVGKGLHFTSTLLVCFGTLLSAFWILSANSWMQAPAGYELVGGAFMVTNWWDVIVNPTVVARYWHMILAAWITAAFVVLSVSAYYLRRNLHIDFSKKCFSFCLWILLFLTTAQMLVGDTVGLNVHKYQPIKTAAIEGVWETQEGAPLLLFAIPDQKAQKNLFEIAIPYGASLINTHKLHGELVGLKTVSREDQPHVPIVFFTFRIMVGLGLLMVLIAYTGTYLRFRKSLFDHDWYLRACQYAAPIGFIALWCGWVTAEVGRQPWIVYNLIRTKDAASDVHLHDVMISFGLIIVVYGIVFGYFYFRYLSKLLRKGPEEIEVRESDQPFGYM
jgi:cytochrome d ubiquinol oxidase subunit I